MIEKMKMETKNIALDNIEKMAELFPSVITEMIDEEKSTPEHKVYKKGINFQMLKQLLSDDVLEGDEAYEFTWVGKKAAIIEANKSIRKILRPCLEESLKWKETENIYIKGDNLEALKLLQESYLGRIKMIYIDPPYNTGNDYIYNDNFIADREDYESELGLLDSEDNKLFHNVESRGRFHSDWCSMIYSRLLLSRNLLSDDGVIFISIDDSEYDNLKKICDEVFGASNFVANIVWQKKFSRSNDATYFSTMHDYILCYAKCHIQSNERGWKIGLLPRGNDIPDGYANPDNDPRGVWTSVVLSAKSGSDKLLYEITTPSGRKCVPPSGRFWSVNADKFQKLVEDNRIWFGKNGDGTPRLKTFLSEVQDGLRPNTILFHEEAGHNQEGKQETKALFDGIGVFDGPKPVRLLQLLMKIANLSDDSIILDFFSGSATTAHAVMKYNSENGNHVKFIMIQLEEKCDQKSEAYKAGFKTICEIGKERIRKAGTVMASTNSAICDLDIGFRVFMIDESNMKDVYYSVTNYTQNMLDMLTSNIKEDRTDLDLLFGCLLEWGLSLSLPHTTEKVENVTIHIINDGDLIACFDENVSDAAIKEIAKKQPLRVVFRDSSFASSPAKINVEEIFSILSPNTKIKVI